MPQEPISKLEAKVKKAFARRLKKAREDAGYKSAAEFARLLREEEHTYRSWEAGKHLPGLTDMTRICKLLRVRPDELLPLAIPGDDASSPRVRAAS